MVEKKIWNQPEMEIQVFVANEYVAVCDTKSWSERGCVGNVKNPDGTYRDFAWFNHTGADTATNNGFTFGEFNSMEWNSHSCEAGNNNPNKKVLYVMDSWMTQIREMWNSKNYTDNDTIDESLWGIGYHAGNSNGHIYDEVFYESHS